MAQSDSRRSLLAGGVSGLLSWAACMWIEGLGAQWAAGLIFGVGVLASSFVGAARRAWLALASVLTYRAAVWLAVTIYGSWVPACAVAGAIGALALSLSVSQIAAVRLERGALRLCVFAGAVAGAFLDLYLRFGDDKRLLDSLLVAACFVTWQASFAVLHRLTPWRMTAPERG